MTILREYLLSFGWAMVGAVSLVLAFVAMMWVLTKLAPFDHWEEIKKNNLSVAIVIAALILSAAMVINKVI